MGVENSSNAITTCPPVANKKVEHEKCSTMFVGGGGWTKKKFS